MTYTRRTAWPGRCLWLILVLLACALPARGEAQQENRLRRIQILPHAGFTRINLFFQETPDYTVAQLPGRIRLSVRNADAPAFRKFRSCTDARVSGVFCSVRDGGLRVVIALRPGEPGVQVLSYGNPSVLSIDIGPGVKRVPQAEIIPGREPILSGAEKFVREFAVPARAGLPFVPTDLKQLKGLLSDNEVKLFQQGEGLLYQEQGSQAIEIFSYFLAKAPAVRALAGYRLAESLSLLERNEEALNAYRQATALWPDYLERSPRLLQSYAEVLAKSGDFAGGRALLTRLIDRLSGTPYAAPLLNRLAEMSERHGDQELALAMYRTVAAHAVGTAAAARARMKLADREMFSLSRDRYSLLLRRYQSLYETPGDFALRDEALFKIALLKALYAPPREALEASLAYDKRYPRGICGTIVKKMREELLLPVYRELYEARDDRALVRLALENREYLARCFGDPEFAPRLARAFRSATMLTQEVELFGYLDDRSWAAGAAPFLSASIVEDALALGNLPLAESTGRSFLMRFPGDPRAHRVREQLGRIAFEKGDPKSVIENLRFLQGKGEKPEFPESDYYLGKALSGAGDHRGAGSSLARFTAAAPAGSPLLVDGYFALAGERVALKEYPGALGAYRQGAQLATGEMADQFLYKMGELYLQLNMVREATGAWEKVAGRGGNGTWVKLASEALSDLKWRLGISSQLP
jgi:tetratricopeptide (TPR) repeat protein